MGELEQNERLGLNTIRALGLDKIKPKMSDILISGEGSVGGAPGNVTKVSGVSVVRQEEKPKKKLTIEVQWVRGQGNSSIKYILRTVGGTYPGAEVAYVCQDTEEKVQRAMKQVNEEYGVVERTGE